LTIALFVAVVSVLSRMYRDSEMAIWMTSGRGVASLLGPVFRFAWPVLLVIAALLVWAWPWSNLQIDTLRDRYERRGDMERIAPGQFQESADGRRVFFIDKSEDDAQEGRNVFIANRDELGQESMTSALKARIDWDGDRQMLSLSQGQRIDQPLNPKTDDLKVSEFAYHALVINQKTGSNGYQVGLKSVPTRELLSLQNRFYAAELSWRLGMTIAAFNFILLAVAVSASNPRSGKSGNMMFLLLGFIFYSNLLNMGQSWIIGEKVHFWVLILWLHGGVFVLCSLWLAKRQYGWRFLPKLNRQGVI
jgi:lipopolysaccharide export system permease protein